MRIVKSTASLWLCGPLYLSGCVESPDISAAEYALTSGASSDPAYLEGVLPGVSFQALLTVGDSPSHASYPMVGIPDGLGAYGGGNPNSFVLLANHELRDTVGAIRAHGAKGAFVSKWRIDKQTGEVLTGEDLIQSVALWSPAAATYAAPAQGVVFNRFCSGDLAATSAFYDDASGLGYDDRLYLNGEESGFGRAFAHDVETGISYELPRLGKVSFENVVARPASGVNTVVAATDDSNPGEILIYVGTKTSCGSPVKRAGLTNGGLFGLKVVGYASEPATGIPSGTPVRLFHYGDVSSLSGAALQSMSTANGVTGFDRPEDAAWNPANPDELYFVTTASFSTSTRLWRVRFVDGANPLAGGVLDLLVDGATAAGTPKMFDNITITADGTYVYLQEDPGNQDHLARIWRYAIATGALEVVAEHVADRFAPGGSSFMTRDEESSGIIDASALLGPGKFLLDVQVHKAHPDPALVEHGQLLLMTVE
jgi:hypothetical protein